SRARITPAAASGHDVPVNGRRVVGGGAAGGGGTAGRPANVIGAPALSAAADEPPSVTTITHVFPARHAASPTVYAAEPEPAGLATPSRACGTSQLLVVTGVMHWRRFTVWPAANPAHATVAAVPSLRSVAGVTVTCGAALAGTAPTTRPRATTTSANAAN